MEEEAIKKEKRRKENAGKQKPWINPWPRHLATEVIETFMKLATVNPPVEHGCVAMMRPKPT
jgi:hypothetical protein